MANISCTVREGIAFYNEYAAQELRVLYNVTPIDGRADMQVRPYRLRKFDGTWRVELCKDNAL